MSAEPLGEAAAPAASQHPAAPPTALEKVVSIGLWAVGILWIVPVMGALMLLQTVRRSDQVEWLNRLYCWGQVALTGSRWRAVVHPDVDPKRQYVFCQNHVNHFDHVTMYRSTPHFKQGIELADHFRYPVYGWFMRQRGTIPVMRGGRNSEEIRARFRDEIAQGHSILAFPEGTRTRDGHVGPFKTGILRIAVELGIPIVPVAVTGMQEVMRKGSWVIRPGRVVTVYCEKPVETAGRGVEQLDRIVEEVRAPIVARVEAYWRERGRG